jgi:hypothetical protein
MALSLNCKFINKNAIKSKNDSIFLPSSATYSWSCNDTLWSSPVGQQTLPVIHFHFQTFWLVQTQFFLQSIKSQLLKRRGYLCKWQEEVTVKMTHGLTTMNAISTSYCTIHILLNPANRMCCYIAMETTKHKTVTELTRNNGFHINWLVGDVWRVSERD